MSSDEKPSGNRDGSPGSERSKMSGNSLASMLRKTLDTVERGGVSLPIIFETMQALTTYGRNLSEDMEPLDTLAGFLDGMHFDGTANKRDGVAAESDSKGVDGDTDAKPAAKCAVRSAAKNKGDINSFVPLLKLIMSEWRINCERHPLVLGNQGIRPRAQKFVEFLKEYEPIAEKKYIVSQYKRLMWVLKDKSIFTSDDEVDLGLIVCSLVNSSRGKYKKGKRKITDSEENGENV